LIARPPLLRRDRRAPHHLADHRGRATLGGIQHDLRALDHPHLLAFRTHDPRELGPILPWNLNALRRRSHTEPPSSLDSSSNEFGDPQRSPATTSELNRRTTSRPRVTARQPL